MVYDESYKRKARKTLLHFKYSRASSLTGVSVSLASGAQKGVLPKFSFTGASSGTGFCRLRKSQIALRFTVVRERLWLKFCFARRFNNLPQITRKLPPNGHCGKLILSRNETAGYFTVISPVIFQFQMLLFFSSPNQRAESQFPANLESFLESLLSNLEKKIIFLKKRKKYIKYQTRKTSIQACIFCVFISYLTSTSLHTLIVDGVSFREIKSQH